MVNAKLLCSITISLCSIGLLIACGIFTGRSKDISASLDLSSATQYDEDWSKPFISSITPSMLVGNLPECPAGSVSLISEMWEGSYSGCDCRGVWSASYYKREVQVNDRCMDDDEDWCIYTPPMLPIEESVVDMRKLCGV